MSLCCYCFATNEVCATIVLLLCCYCYAVGVVFAIMLLLLVNYVSLLCRATIVGEVCVVSVS